MTNDINADIKTQPASDGTIDKDFTWGRPVSKHLAPYQHLRILILKHKLKPLGELRNRSF